jgi:hypothetical protein
MHGHGHANHWKHQKSVCGLGAIHLWTRWAITVRIASWTRGMTLLHKESNDSSPFAISILQGKGQAAAGAAVVKTTILIK